VEKKGTGMEWYEAAFDRMYPVIYRHRDIAEAETVMKAFAPYLRGKEPVLDLACGSGRYLEALQRQRFNVMGLDLSHYLLKACVDKWGHGDEIVQGDMRHLPFASGSIGSIINMFTSFGYFSRDTDNVLVFQEANRVLASGGVFLFDFINAGRIAAEHLGESEREEGYYHIREKRRIEMHGKYLVKEITILNQRIDERTSITERLRLYTHDDLVAMFLNLGFTIREIFGDYQLNPFVAGVSDRVVVLAEKP
jgi:SAM-dependent methyltransferase